MMKNVTLQGSESYQITIYNIVSHKVTQGGLLVYLYLVGTKYPPIQTVLSDKINTILAACAHCSVLKTEQINLFCMGFNFTQKSAICMHVL